HIRPFPVRRPAPHALAGRPAAADRGRHLRLYAPAARRRGATGPAARAARDISPGGSGNPASPGARARTVAGRPGQRRPPPAARDRPRRAPPRPVRTAPPSARSRSAPPPVFLPPGTGRRTGPRAHPPGKTVGPASGALRRLDRPQAET